jgi:hypothetical protein
VDFEVSFAADSQKGRTRARQLSEFGILIGPIDHPRLMLEKHVQLQFAIPGEKPWSLKGFCAYVTPTAAGIRFETIPEDIKGMLSRFVNQDPLPKVSNA